LLAEVFMSRFDKVIDSMVNAMDSANGRADAYAQAQAEAIRAQAQAEAESIKAQAQAQAEANAGGGGDVVSALVSGMKLRAEQEKAGGSNGTT